MSSASGNRESGLVVAVVGATGLVGRTMIRILEERNFPVADLRPMAASGAGRSVRFKGSEIAVAEATPAAFEGVDIALFSAGAEVSLQLAPEAARRGCTVVDNSSAWRMDPTVPLVVSQVNPEALDGHRGIIANPNCSTMQLAPLLHALQQAAGLKRVVVATYQAVSGLEATPSTTYARNDGHSWRGRSPRRQRGTTQSPKARSLPSTCFSQTGARRRRRRWLTRAARFSAFLNCALARPLCAYQLRLGIPRRCTWSSSDRSRPMMHDLSLHRQRVSLYKMTLRRTPTRLQQTRRGAMGSTSAGYALTRAWSTAWRSGS